MPSQRGQASADYIAVVAVVATVLLAVGAAARMPELPGTVVQTVRTGLCIVGGDVCRASDARAEGLEPCVVRGHEGLRHSSITFLFARVSQDRGYAVELRSDGTSRVVATEGSALAASGEPALRLGASVAVKAGGQIGLVWRSGQAWELPDRASLERLLAQAKGRPGEMADRIRRGATPMPAPTERFFEGGDMGELTAGAQVFSVRQPVLSGAARHAIGRRVRAGRTSWYFDASGDGPRLFGGLLPGVELKGKSAWTLEVTEGPGHRPERLQLQTAIPGKRANEIEELSASLDLTIPANAAAARDLLALEREHTPLALARARAVGRHLLRAGTIERRLYRVRARPSDFDAELSIGVFGGEHTGDAHQRDLVAAEVIRDGGRARRADCVGL
jgi:hypothetical protein